jgi:adenylate cyclase
MSPPSSRFQKPSFSTTISNMRQGSASSSILRQPRKSDSHSTLSTEDYKRHSAEEPHRERLDSSTSSLLLGAKQVRKVKSSMFSRLKTKSKSALRPDQIEAEHPSLRTPPPPIPDRDASFLPVLKKSERKKSNSQPPSPDAEFTLDTNIEHMEGIINLDSIHSSPPSAFPSYARSLTRSHSPPSLNLHTDVSSPSSGFDSSSHLSISLSDHSFYSTYYSPVTSADFSNPFLPTPLTAAAKRKGIQPRFKDKDKDKDKRTPPAERPLPPLPATIGSRWPDTTNWMAPESWAVEKVGDADELAAGESSSSEDSDPAIVPRRTSAIPPHAVVRGDGVTVVNGHPPVYAHPPLHPPPPPKRRRPTKHRSSNATAQPMRIRIYRANSAFHIATITPQVDVASLTPALNEKLLQGKGVETHRLYLKERGRGECFFGSVGIVDVDF